MLLRHGLHRLWRSHRSFTTADATTFAAAYTTAGSTTAVALTGALTAGSAICTASTAGIGDRACFCGGCWHPQQRHMRGRFTLRLHVLVLSRTDAAPRVGIAH